MADILTDAERIAIVGIESKRLISNATALISQLEQVKTSLLAIRDRVQTETTIFTAEDLTALNQELSTLQTNLRTLAGCP